MGRVVYFARVRYGISDGVVVVGWVLEATWIGVRNLQPAGVLCELPRLFCGNSHSNAAFNLCLKQSSGIICQGITGRRPCC